MSPRTILLADADPDSRAVYALILEHHGFTVLHARDGAEAHYLARERQPDVIVAELFLRGGEGKPIASRLKEDERTAALPLIGLTVLPTTLGIAPGLLACDSHLVKPCTPSRLLREVERVLESAPAL